MTIYATVLNANQSSYSMSDETKVTDKELEMRSVEHGICPIATSIMNKLFQ